MLSRAPRSLPRTPIRGPGAGSASTMPTDDAIFIPLCGLHKAMVIPESLPRTRYGAEFLRAGTVPNPEGRGLPLLLPSLRPSALPLLPRRAVPSSGNSATRVKVSVGPTPGTLRSSSSCSRHTGLSRGVGKSVQPSMNTNVQPPLPQLLPPLPQGEGWGEGDSPSLRPSALPQGNRILTGASFGELLCSSIWEAVCIGISFRFNSSGF